MRGALTSFIARRYLLSRASHSIINIISVVSSLTVAIPTAALIVLLSVYNGLDGFIKDMYRNFDPQLTITAKEGRFFQSTDIKLDDLRAVAGVEKVTMILEDNALFSFRDNQTIGSIRGVDDNYYDVTPFDSIVVSGISQTTLGDINYAIPGAGVAYNLGINSFTREPITVLSPKSDRGASFLPTSFYRSADITPMGIFAIDAETDGRYVVVPLRFARQLVGRGEECVSMIGVKLKPDASENSVREAIARMVGDNFKILNRYEQKETLFKIMNSEKYGIYAVALLVIIVASLSLIGAVVMFVSDKRGEIEVLKTAGATDKFISNIFIKLGVYISVVGVALGLIVGCLLVWAQQSFGFVRVDAVSMLIDAYPVKLQITDLVSVALSVLIINFVISKLTVVAITGKKS